MARLPQRFDTFDEAGVQKAPYSRTNVQVLASVDLSKVDRSLARDPSVNDLPIAWARSYGKGRVFYSTLGHLDAAWDNPIVQKMYFQALLWVMRVKVGSPAAPGAPEGHAAR